MELSVTQHKLKTQITADAKETEKQNEMQKKRSRINTSSSMLSLTGGGQFGNMGMMGGMASVCYFFIVLLFVYMYIYICFYFLFRVLLHRGATVLHNRRVRCPTWWGDHLRV